jgi:hypothetical protein
MQRMRLINFPRSTRGRSKAVVLEKFYLIYLFDAAVCAELAQYSTMQAWHADDERIIFCRLGGIINSSATRARRIM